MIYIYWLRCKWRSEPGHDNKVGKLRNFKITEYNKDAFYETILLS